MANRQQPLTTKKPEIAHGINPAIDVVQAIQQGEIPSTASVATVLDKSEKSLDETLVSAPDEQTRILVRDTQAAMEAAKEFVSSKSIGERAQIIYKESELAAQSGEDFPNAAGLNEEDRRILREMRSRFFEGAVIGRELLRMIIMNPSFRDGLLRMMNLAYDIFYKVGEDVAKDQPPVEANVKPEDRASQAKETAEKALKSGRTDPQRRELASQLRKLLQELRDNDLYQRGVNNLFRLADLVKISSEKAGEKLEKMDVEIQAEPHTKKALEETKALAEEFLPEEMTLDPLLAKLKNFVVAAKSDKALSEHFNKWRKYVETTMKEPGKISTDEFLKEGDELADEALNLQVSDELRKSGQVALREWKDVIDNFKQDEQLNTLNLTMKKLMHDITKRDSQGRTSIDLQALARFRPIVVELVKKNLESIPLPDVKGEDETYKWKAWNLVANGSEILPDYISVESSTRSEAAIKDTTRPSWLQGDLIISIDNIRTKLDNVQFWYERKAFPRGEDTGFMDINVAGGISIVIKLVLEASDVIGGGLLFTGGSVYCEAKDVRVRLRETKHDILYNLFSGSWERPIKDNIEKYVAEKLASAIQDFKAAANERVAEFQKTGIESVIPDVLKQQVTA